jgi:hypothetical protein
VHYLQDGKNGNNNVPLVIFKLMNECTKLVFSLVWATIVAKVLPCVFFLSDWNGQCW